MKLLSILKRRKQMLLIFSLMASLMMWEAYSSLWPAWSNSRVMGWAVVTGVIIAAVTILFIEWL